MATNLRLNPEIEAGLRQRATESGRSQQDIIREAIRLYLEQEIHQAMPSLDGPRLRPPRTPFRVAEVLLPLPKGVKSSLELLDREDRL
ncbi:MAG TPA: CopG family transcriptional regulator [Galbitalea sp.]